MAGTRQYLGPTRRCAIAGAALLALTARIACAADAAEALQHRIDAANGPVELPGGTLVLNRPLRITRDGVVLQGRGRDATILRAGFAGAGDAVVAIGPADPARMVRGKSVLAAPARADATEIELGEALKLAAGDILRLRAANDSAFFDRLDARGWRKETPLRQTLVRVAGGQGRRVQLVEPLGLDLPAGTAVEHRDLVRGAGVRDLSIDYAIGGAPDPSVYENVRPDHVVDGVRFNQTADGVVEQVDIRNAGRHPLFFETSLSPRVRRVALTGAWNKGNHGNGYLRISRTFRGRYDDVRLRGLRHLAIHWSSHHNAIAGLDSDCDINFHGGFAHHNVVQVNRLELRPGHKWDRITRTAPDAHWASPDGEGNRVLDPSGRELNA